MFDWSIWTVFFPVRGMGLSVGQDSTTIASVKSLIVELENCDTLL